MAHGCLSNAASAAACAGGFRRALDFADRCLPLVVTYGLLRLSVYAQTARLDQSTVSSAPPEGPA